MAHVITFAQQKGGAGKTTVLAHLAAGWAADGLSVALVDLDPQQSLTRWAKLRGDPALTMVESRDYRAAGDIRAAARKHDRVLIDCPGTASNLLDAVIRESDLVLSPCQPSVIDAWATQHVAEAAARLKRPIRIVLNRIPPRTSTIDDVLAALGPNAALLLDARLGNRVAFSNAFITGRTAPELNRNSTAARETEALRDEVNGVLGAL